VAFGSHVSEKILLLIVRPYVSRLSSHECSDQINFVTRDCLFKLLKIVVIAYVSISRFDRLHTVNKV